MKKLILIFMLMLAFVLPHFAEASTFSGHSSYRHSSTIGSHVVSSFSSGSTYHSGYKSASTNVNRTPSHTQASAQPSSKFRSFLTHAAAFGAGAYIGKMLNPFGGHNYGSHPMAGSGFSILGILMDILVIVLIVWVIKKVFRMRR
ncbi:hypothetical protein [Bacillus sp. EB600]|uniref:hypothetical protein n=1 Tax=Bacillus sp. EB600 TaxID=2806345 RepID=UPI00210F14AF|nr:hypothetical protein [Bacillus sp. EB600]MCQ6282209.1 hypothetical protein [Bacillus sp. EB600]